jgi:prevent-host-death family protein
MDLCWHLERLVFSRPRHTRGLDFALERNPNVAILLARFEEPEMRFASVAEVKNGLSKYLARARRKKESIVVTHHGKPYALIQPLSEEDLEELEWRGLARKKLSRAWEGEEDALYDYL